jgi:hypothetical protein
MGNIQMRQGDVMLRKVEPKEFKNPKEVKLNVVAVGEGHHEHRVFGEGVEVLEEEGTIFIKVAKKAELRHVHAGTVNQAEHNPLTIEEGLWEVVHQRQYDPYKQAVERVRD